MKKIILLLSLALLIAACSDKDKGGNAQAKEMTMETVPQRVMDFAQVTRGAKLYQQNCASCHGRVAEGASHWRAPQPGGNSAPPLNGTGHAWHHPMKTMHYTIKYGSPGGKGKMPAWKDKLTDQEISDVIAWFQSKWSDRVYVAWYKRDKGQHRM